eukprot:gene3569-7096_t
MNETEQFFEKVESFYLALRSGSIDELCLKLRDLEELVVVSEHQNDDCNVIKEITNDCQKKACQAIRAYYADDIRNIITSSRKKLNMKTSLDSDNATQHTNRHLNILIELLGTWSNIIASINDYNISFYSINLIISPLHTRIIEMAFDCYESFKEDKNLNSWQIKTQNETAEYSIVTLDSILSQMSSMKEVIIKYKTFYLNYIEPSQMNNFENDFQKWREVDFIYIGLESAYLMRAVTHSLQEITLLEVEEGIFVLQAVEDTFFLLQRVIERCLRCGSEMSLMAIGNRVVEVLDSLQDSNIFSLLQDAQSVHTAYEHFKIQSIDPSSPFPSQLSSSLLDNSYSTPSKTPRGKNYNNGIGIDTASTPSSSVMGSVAANSLGADLAVGAVALAESATSLAGDWLSVFSPATTNTTTTSTNVVGVQTGSNSVNSSANKSVSLPVPVSSSIGTPYSWLENLAIARRGANNTNTHSNTNTPLDPFLAAALELDSNGHGCSYYLSEVERAGLINSIAVAICSINTFGQIFDNSDNSSGSSSIMESSSVSLIVQELNRCKLQYEGLLVEELNNFIQQTGLLQMNNSFKKLLQSSNYNISGDDMERRSGNSDVVRLVANVCGDGGRLEKEFSKMLSVLSFDEPSKAADALRMELNLIKALSTLLGGSILEAILSLSFSEWGAMLVNEEVLCIVDLLEQSVDSILEGVRLAFAPLLLALKILTLDQPGDIRRYTIPRNTLDEDIIRKIMSCRTDFSVEAIAKVKLNIKNSN